MKKLTTLPLLLTLLIVTTLLPGKVYAKKITSDACHINGRWYRQNTIIKGLSITCKRLHRKEWYAVSIHGTHDTYCTYHRQASSQKEAYYFDTGNGDACPLRIIYKNRTMDAIYNNGVMTYVRD
jgi:hypothetical protein